MSQKLRPLTEQVLVLGHRLEIGGFENGVWIPAKHQKAENAKNTRIPSRAGLGSLGAVAGLGKTSLGGIDTRRKAF